MRVFSKKVSIVAIITAVLFYGADENLPVDIASAGGRHAFNQDVSTHERRKPTAYEIPPAPDARIEYAVRWASFIAVDQSHGYSHGVENATKDYPYTGSREGPDYDCASFIYHALDQAGFDIIEAWKNNPAFYNLYHGKQQTGDADTIWYDLETVGGFSKYKWDEIKYKLIRGDILCNPEYHAAIYIGNGVTVEARGVENPRGGDWQTGDQGGEIGFYDAYGRDWTEVYRYTGNNS